MAEREQRQRRRAWVRALGASLALGAFALLAAFVAIAAISLGVARESLRQTLEEEATAALGAAVSIGEIGGPLYPRMTLRNVSIGVDGETAIAIERARLRLDLWPALFGDAIAIRTIAISGWRVVARRRADHSWNLSAIGSGAEDPTLRQPPDPAEASAARAVEIDRLVLSKGVVVVHWSDEAPPLTLRANLEADSLRTPLDQRSLARARIRGLAVLDEADTETRGRARLRLEDGLLRFEAGELALPFGAADFSAEADAASWLDSGREATASLEASVREFDLAALSADTALSSRLFAKLKIEARRAAGDGGALDLTVAGTVAPSELGGAQIRSGALRGRLRGDAWQLEALELDADLASLRASGRGRGDRLDVLQAEATVPELAALAPFLEGAPALAGALEASLSVQGAPAAPKTAVRLRGRELRIEDRELGALEIDASMASALGPADFESDAGGSVLDRLRGRDWQLARLDLDSSFATLRASGRGRGDRLDALQAEATVPELAALAPFLEGAPALAGALEASLSVQGAPAAPKTAVRLRGRELRIEDRELGALEIDASMASALGPADFESDAGGSVLDRLRGRDWQLARLDLDSSFATLRASGRGRGDQLEALQAEATFPELAALAPFLEGAPALAGALEASLSVQGAATAPNGTVRISGQGLRVEDRELGALALAAELRGDAAELHELSLTGGLLPLELEAPAIFRRSTATPSGVTLDGLALRSGNQRLELRGSIDATRLDGLELRLRELDLAECFRLAGVLDLATDAPPLSGRIDVDASLSGSPRRPLGEASVVVSQIRVPQPAAGTVASNGSRALLGFGGGSGFTQNGAQAAARTASLPNEIRAQILARDDRLSVEATLGRSDSAESALQLEASLPWSARDLETPATLFDGPDAQLRIRGDSLDLALLGPWLPRAIRDPGGHAELAIDAVGTPEGPRLSGRVGIRDGAFTVPVAHQRYAPIDAELRIAGDHLSLERFDVGPPDARASLEGSLQLAGARPASFALNADFRDFALSQSPLLRTDVLGKAHVSGSLEALRIEGDLALTDARVLLPEADDRELKEIRVIAADASADGGLEIVERGRELGVWDAASVDLNLSVPPSWVRSRGTELELEGAIELHKQPRDVLRAIGEAKAVRGNFRFQGARFEVRRGTVTFDGGEEIANPLIDLVGVRHVRDVDIVLQLGGRASDPELVKLGGEPPMSEEEAFAYLVFGRPLEELGSTERGGVESAVLSLATRMALDEFGLLVGSARIIDTIDLELDEEGGLGSVRVGRYLGKRTFVRYGQSFGAEGDQDLEIEYRLTPNLSIESQMTTSGDAGADLIWRSEY